MVSFSRRLFLKAAGCCLLKPAFPTVALAQQADDDGADIKTVPVIVPWKSVIHLDISDPTLKKHVEEFLTFFEHSSFPYDEMDPLNHITTRKELSGPSVLLRIKDIIQAEISAGLDIPKFAHAYSMFQQRNIAEDKLTIVQHDMPFNGKADQGSFTMFVGTASRDVALPIAIGIGKPYLLGAKYLGVDGKHYPVSVDGVVAHELAHYAFVQRGEDLPLGIEGIVTTAMGAVQRDVGTSRIEYAPNGNGEYTTLYDKLRPDEPASQSRMASPPKPTKG